MRLVGRNEPLCCRVYCVVIELLGWRCPGLWLGFQDGLHFLKSGTGIVIRLERRAATVYAASAAGQAWRMGFPGFFTALGTASGVVS